MFFSYITVRLVEVTSVEPLAKENISFIISLRQLARKNPAPLRKTKISHTPPATVMQKINFTKTTIISSIWHHLIWLDRLKQLHYFKTFKHVIYVLR